MSKRPNYMRFRPTTDTPPAETIREHIDRNLTDSELTIARIASDMAMGRSSLYREWNAHFRIPIHSYILRRRLELAQEMLRTGRFRVTDVALGCGFASQAHFSKAYKSMFGNPPIQDLGTTT